ncbi:hypothetical protein SAMN05444162_2549 [Paenibacillaceae bacterium GAS479]|nr:hypothetical protein SAMN05444162_2549 [Paenibacillaceae bacterium GAS479]
MKKGMFFFLTIVVVAGAVMIWMSNNNKIKIDGSETTLDKVLITNIKGNITEISYINFRDTNAKLKFANEISDITDALSSIKIKEVTLKEYQKLTTEKKDDFNVYFIVNEGLSTVYMNKYSLYLSILSKDRESITKRFEIIDNYDYERIKSALEK